MATVLPTASRNAACDAVVDKVDQGAAAGKLKIRASTTILCTITLEDPAFGAASTGVATGASFPKSAAASASGTADNYIVTDSDDTIIIGPVDLTEGSGSNQIDNTDINSGQTVNVSTLTHTQPAS